MKKLIIGCAVILSSCGNSSQEGTFVSHFQHEFSRVDDTINIKDGIVIRRTGFNKIRNGVLKPRQYEIEKWRLNEPGSVVIVFEGDDITVGTAVYKKLKSYESQ